MRTEVYSWRLSSELKSDLEREARSRKVSVSSVLETAVRDWLKKGDADASEDEAQRRLHTAAANCFGALASGNPRRAETARDALRQWLRRRHARRTIPVARSMTSAAEAAGKTKRLPQR